MPLGASEAALMAMLGPIRLVTEGGLERRAVVDSAAHRGLPAAIRARMAVWDLEEMAELTPASMLRQGQAAEGDVMAEGVAEAIASAVPPLAAAEGGAVQV